MKVLTPLPGRDYTSGKAAKLDFLANKDFILNDITSRWDGKPINRSQVRGETVLIRFNTLRSTTKVDA